MEFGGTYLILAARYRVWQALNDTAVLRAAIPGCVAIDWVSPSSLDLRVRVNLGPLRPEFAGGLELSNVQEARSYTLCGHARGRLLGLARARADVRLLEHVVNARDLERPYLSLAPRDPGPPGGSVNFSLQNGTILQFSAHGRASEKIMSLGRGLIGRSAQRIIDGFMARFSSAMGAPVAAMSPPEMAKEPGDGSG